MKSEQEKRGDLTVTALYTAQVWKWAGFDGGELFGTRRGRDVFNATNLSLGITRVFRRGLPLLRHSLAQRHAMIDALVAESECTQVLELAAGLSRRGAALSTDPELHYVEVDLPAVVTHKRDLLMRSERGRAVAARDNLRMLEGDALTMEFEDALCDGPVCVIAEGLLMYLDAAAQQQLWKRLATVCANHPGSSLVFDLVPFCEQPKPGAFGRSLRWLFKQLTGGADFAFDDRSRDDLVAELRACGFADVALFEPATAPERWVVPFENKHTQTLVFHCR